VIDIELDAEYGT